MRIALAVIAGPDAIEDGFERMLRSVESKVSGVYVAYTGSDSGVGDETFDRLANAIDPSVFKEGAVVPIGWNQDFSAARNASFDLVRDAMVRDGVAYDFILWLDCDDIIPPEVNLSVACADILDRRAHGGFMEYQYDYDDVNDMALVTHFKERLFRADINWRWQYPIHENCRGPMGVRMTKLGPEHTVRHLRGEVAPKRKRNQSIVAEWFKREGGTESRAVMFMAHETYARAEQEGLPDADRRSLYMTALKLYKRFISMSPPDDDAYACNRQVAEILMRIGRYEDSINIDLQGVKMQPEMTGSYIGIAVTYHAMGDFENALTWAKNARLVQQPSETLGAHIVLEDQYKPLMVMGDCFEQLGMHEKAYWAFAEATKIYFDEWTLSRLEKAKSLRRGYREMRIAGTKTTNREMFWGARPEKSICFFVPPSIEDWNPSKLKDEGLGGTETSIIKLADQFAKQGWRVVIFGQPGAMWEDVCDESYDGSIEWYRASQWHPDEHFTVFVGLRSPQIFDSPINAQVKILWLHDIAMGPTRYSEDGVDRFSEPDVIVYPSPFHFNHIIKVYDGRSDPWEADNQVIMNGFDVSRFHQPDADESIRDPARIMYASSPDRGLVRLLELWPQIAERVPGASLNIYYGWDSINAIIEKELPSGPMLAYFKAKVEAMIDKLRGQGHHIHWYGRVSETRLARHMQLTGVMAYPANFMETFGIVFAQAMASGVIPVVPKLGFLPQLVGANGIVVPGAPDSMEFGDRFVAAVVAATAPPEGVRSGLAEDVAELDWSDMMGAWESLIQRRLTVNQEAGAFRLQLVRGEGA